MLPAAARLRHRDEFVTALRCGRRRTDGSRPALVVTHVAPTSGDKVGNPVAAERPGDKVGNPAAAERPTRVGFTVSRAVGSAVVRNQVRRRLRHLMAARLTGLPAGSLVVVRALPASASASSADLSVALDRALAPAPTQAPSAEGRERR